jgi:hypothetical protein
MGNREIATEAAAAEYAAAECERCHVILPKPEMSYVTETHWRGFAKAYWRQNWSYLHREREGRWLCHDCFKPPRSRRAGLNVPAALSVLVFLIAVIFLATTH